MRAGWPSKALAEVCEIKPPKSEAKSKLKDADSVSFVPMEDLGIDQKFLEPRSERKLGQVAGSYTYFADGDVLLAKITPCFENGKLGIARGLKNGVGFGSSEYIVFRSSDELSSEYLYYFLLQDSFRAGGISTMSGAVGHKRVSKEYIERCKIPLPPPSEQQRIVAILDEAFAGLATATANAEKNLKSARELFESYLGLALGQAGEHWPVWRLEETVGDSCSLSYGIVQPGDEEVGGLPIVRPVDMTTKIIRVDGLKRIDASFAKAYSRTRLRGGELLLCVRGTTGAVSIAAAELAGANVTRGIVPIFFNASLLTQRFGYYVLLSERVQRQVREKTYGTALMQINIRDLRNLLIPIPPLAEQEDISERLDVLSEHVVGLQKIYQRGLTELHSLKQGLLQKAFSGELAKKPRAIVASDAKLLDAKRDTALVIALAYERHKRNNRGKSFRHTKEQKILHMVEAEAGFDLGRQPIRDAAGPNDFHHMLNAEEWADGNRYFRVSEYGTGYQFQPLARFSEFLNTANSIDSTTRKKIERVIDVFIPMDAQEAEVFATVYSAWNNLLIEGRAPTDDEIVKAAREDWHPNKLSIPRAKFVEGLRQVRVAKFIPQGQGKFVPPPAQGRLDL